MSHFHDSFCLNLIFYLNRILLLKYKTKWTSNFLWFRTLLWNGKMKNMLFPLVIYSLNKGNMYYPWFIDECNKFCTKPSAARQNEILKSIHSSVFLPILISHVILHITSILHVLSFLLIQHLYSCQLKWKCTAQQYGKLETILKYIFHHMSLRNHRKFYAPKLGQCSRFFRKLFGISTLDSS